MASFRLTIEDGWFCDGHGRQVVLRGINVAGDAKLPSEPDQPSHVGQGFFDGDGVSFHQRPFSKEEAPVHFARIRLYGFNTVRYVFTWEAIEAAGPGRYDEAFIQHTIAVLRVARAYGLYVFMDPHQDVWSRFAGGSGAPPVDHLRLRPRPPGLRRHRGGHCPQHVRRPGPLPQDDLVDKLLPPRRRHHLHLVLRRPRLCAPVRHRRRQHPGLPAASLHRRLRPPRLPHTRGWRPRGPRRRRLGEPQRAQQGHDGLRRPGRHPPGPPAQERHLPDHVADVPDGHGQDLRGRHLGHGRPRPLQDGHGPRRPRRRDCLAAAGLRRLEVRLEAGPRLAPRRVHLGPARRVGPGDGHAAEERLLPKEPAHRSRHRLPRVRQHVLYGLLEELQPGLPAPPQGLHHGDAVPDAAAAAADQGHRRRRPPHGLCAALLRRHHAHDEALEQHVERRRGRRAPRPVPPSRPGHQDRRDGHPQLPEGPAGVSAARRAGPHRQTPVPHDRVWHSLRHGRQEGVQDGRLLEPVGRARRQLLWRRGLAHGRPLPVALQRKQRPRARRPVERRRSFDPLARRQGAAGAAAAGVHPAQPVGDEPAQALGDEQGGGGRRRGRRHAGQHPADADQPVHQLEPLGQGPRADQRAGVPGGRGVYPADADGGGGRRGVEWLRPAALHLQPQADGAQGGGGRGADGRLPARLLLPQGPVRGDGLVRQVGAGLGRGRGPAAAEAAVVAPGGRAEPDGAGAVRKHNISEGSAEEAGYLEQCQEGYGFNLGNCVVM